MISYLTLELVQLTSLCIEDIEVLLVKLRFCLTDWNAF